jgi:hypothetical protein
MLPPGEAPGAEAAAAALAAAAPPLDFGEAAGGGSGWGPGGFQGAIQRCCNSTPRGALRRTPCACPTPSPHPRPGSAPGALHTIRAPAAPGAPGGPAFGAPQTAAAGDAMALRRKFGGGGGGGA